MSAAAFFLLPLWEKVAVGGLWPPFFNWTPMLCIGYAQSATDEGFSPWRQTPHPSAMLRIAATLSHKGRGEEEFATYALAAFLRYARCTAQVQPGGCDETSLAGTAAARASVDIAPFTRRSCADRSCAGM